MRVRRKKGGEGRATESSKATQKTGARNLGWGVEKSHAVFTLGTLLC